MIKDLASPANEANTVTGVAITNNVPAVVGISDNFNRADASVPGGPWTVLAGTGSINSNKAGNNGSGGPADMVANLGHADTVLSAKVTIGTGGYPWLHFRGDGTAANRLEIYFNAGGTFDFGKKIAGAYTSLANASHGLAVGVESAIVLTLSGSSVSMTVNGVSKLSTTTTQWQTQTYVGYAPSVPDDRFDDFNAT